MNILFVNATRTWGGIKTWMLRLGEFLQANGHYAAFACRKNDDLAIRCREESLPCHPVVFGPDYSPKAIYQFLKILKKDRIDLIVTNTSKEIRTAGIAAKILGIAHLNRLGLYGDIRDRFKVRLEYNRLVDRIIVPSPRLYDHLSQFEFVKDKLKMVCNGVKTFPLRLSNDEVVKFAVVANLSARKQIDKVLEAFAQLPKELEWEFHIGGYGPELEKLKAMRQELSLSDRVFFDGKVLDPYEYLKDKDVGILYSTSEGLPNALLEYMTTSCAVIASDIDGVNEIIEHEINGLLAAPSDTASLAGAIRQMIEDPDLRRRLTKNAHQKIMQEFNVDELFKEIENELQILIGKKAGR